MKVTQSCPTLQPHELYSPWNSPGLNTGVGSLALLQRIFPTQGSNPGLPHHRQILYQLSHKGSPRILEWVAYPFSNGSSHPRNWTRVSCIADRFFTKLFHLLQLLSHVQFFATSWSVAHQAPSMGFSRQEYWSGLPCPPPGDRPSPEFDPVRLMCPVLASRFFTTSVSCWF